MRMSALSKESSVPDRPEVYRSPNRERSRERSEQFKDRSERRIIGTLPCTAPGPGYCQVGYPGNRENGYSGLDSEFH